jgi:hypothetical protein
MAKKSAPAPAPAPSEAPSPGAAAAADQAIAPVENRIEDLSIALTFPMGLTKGVVTLPDGRTISRTRVNALLVNAAILEAWNDPTAPEQEHP